MTNVVFDRISPLCEIVSVSSSASVHADDTCLTSITQSRGTTSSSVFLLIFIFSLTTIKTSALTVNVYHDDLRAVNFTFHQRVGQRPRGKLNENKIGN